MNIKIVEKQTDNMDLQQFVENVSSFINFINIKKHDSLIMQVLQTFRTIPNVDSASFFIVDKESFEFNHKLTLPNEYKESNIELFYELLEQGIINQVIRTSTTIIYPDINESSSQLNRNMLIPIVSKAGWFGIINLSFNYYNKKINSTLTALCQLLGNLYAVSLDNNILSKHLENTKKILDQKVTAKNLKQIQNERELNAILDSVHSAVMIIDASSGIILKANTVARELIGSTESELNDSDYRTFLDFSRKELIRTKEFFSYKNGFQTDLIKHKNTSNQFKNFESELKKIDGNIIPILRSISFITIGNEHYRIESFFDISATKSVETKLRDSFKQLEAKMLEKANNLQRQIGELKKEVSRLERNEKQLIKSLENAKKLNEMKTDSVSMISHEMKTPLTIIRSSAQLLEKFGSRLSKSESLEYIGKIIKTVDSMKDLIDNIIFIGNAESEALRLSPTSINLSELCNSIINDIKFTIGKQRKIKYSLEGSEFIVTDGKLLSYVLNNLLTNALKYSPDGKPVEVMVRCTANKAIILVKDYGIGIDESEQRKIFEIFYRGNNVGTISGTGLGMSVILKSLELLNGKIEVSSIINEGSTFKITLPSLKMIK